jgi:hypothetical protein
MKLITTARVKTDAGDTLHLAKRLSAGRIPIGVNLSPIGPESRLLVTGAKEVMTFMFWKWNVSLFSLLLLSEQGRPVRSQGKRARSYLFQNG